jgi:hypothetical protein
MRSFRANQIEAKFCVGDNKSTVVTHAIEMFLH